MDEDELMFGEGEVIILTQLLESKPPPGYPEEGRFPPPHVADGLAQPSAMGGSMDAAAASVFPYGNGDGDGSALPPAMCIGCCPGLSSREEAARFAPPNAPLDWVKVVGEILEENAGTMGDNDQWSPAAGVAQQEWPAPQLQVQPSVMDYDVMPWSNQFDANRMGMNQTTFPNQFHAGLLQGANQRIIDNSAAATDQVHMPPFGYYPHEQVEMALQYYPHGSAEGTGYPQQHMLDNEAMEMAELRRVASECGDEASVVWSPEEDRVLLDGLSRLGDQDIVCMCIEIACCLPKKTAMDVAKRIRWVQNKNISPAQTGVISKESKGRTTRKPQAGVGSTESARRKGRKGKGNEGPNVKRNKYVPSESFKTIQAQIRDNSRLMDRIDDNLKTGQLMHIPNIFNDVTTNMGAILTKMREMGISTDQLKIDVEALEEVTQGFPPPSANDAIDYLPIRRGHVSNSM
ncbi:uncharacterized protein LOC102708881 [Oryza brachyantha]|uniref:uncharacterized protein LOC102708881 n=1 Tax=Oryza brachyantha TaxID=4533 RepID=UPI0007760F10|nr:uncharacterized protein LOC102708881 [Oryza brachyantha]